MYLRGKLHDVLMVIGTLLLFLLNTADDRGAGAAAIAGRGRGARAPVLRLHRWGGCSGELLAFLFLISLFYLVYRYASDRRLPWKTALMASAFAALAFELAKRLYAWYLANVASLSGPSGDANVGAAVLFVLWIYYTALVFLLGGVVAETWELRQIQRQQRAILG